MVLTHGLITQMRAGEDSVVSGSYDSTLRLWCLKTGACRKVLRGHADRVLCLFWDGDTLLSGSTDQTIKVRSSHFISPIVY